MYLSLIHSFSPSENVRRLGMLSGNMGIRPQYVQVGDAPQVIEAVNDSSNGIIIDVASVSKVVAENQLDGFATLLHQCDAPVLLFLRFPEQLADPFIQV